MNKLFLPLEKSRRGPTGNYHPTMGDMPRLQIQTPMWFQHQHVDNQIPQMNQLYSPTSF